MIPSALFSVIFLTATSYAVTEEDFNNLKRVVEQLQATVTNQTEKEEQRGMLYGM